MGGAAVAARRGLGRMQKSDRERTLGVQRWLLGVALAACRSLIGSVHWWTAWKARKMEPEATTPTLSKRANEMAGACQRVLRFREHLMLEMAKYSWPLWA